MSKTAEKKVAIKATAHERWIVLVDGHQVYPGDGVSRAEAERLARGLALGAKIKRIDPH